MKVPDFSQVRSVLVVKPSSLGDVVHTLPAVHRLKQCFPHLQIDWLVNPEWSPLLEGNPDIKETVLFPRSSFKGRGGWSRYRHWMHEFKWRPPPDVVLDFQGLLRSAWISRQSGARTIIGLSDSREGARWLHHIRVPVEPTDHAVDRYLKLVAACGAAEGPVQFPLPIGKPPAGISQASLPQDFVILHPFSRGEKKSLSPAQVKSFCEMIAPVAVILVGRAEVTEELRNISPNTFNFLNKTSLAELIWLMRRAKFIVSVDSGPMHIAAAINPRVLGIHTWSDPRLVGPYPPEAFIWKGGKILPRIQADNLLAPLVRQVDLTDVEPMVDFVLEQIAP